MAETKAEAGSKLPAGVKMPYANDLSTTPTTRAAEKVTHPWELSDKVYCFRCSKCAHEFRSRVHIDGDEIQWSDNKYDFRCAECGTESSSKVHVDNLCPRWHAHCPSCHKIMSDLDFSTVVEARAAAGSKLPAGVKMPYANDLSTTPTTLRAHEVKQQATTRLQKLVVENLELKNQLAVERDHVDKCRAWAGELETGLNVLLKAVRWMDGALLETGLNALLKVVRMLNEELQDSDAMEPLTETDSARAEGGK